MTPERADRCRQASAASQVATAKPAKRRSGICVGFSAARAAGFSPRAEEGDGFPEARAAAPNPPAEVSDGSLEARTAALNPPGEVRDGVLESRTAITPGLVARATPLSPAAEVGDRADIGAELDGSDPELSRERPFTPSPGL
jgi:hypothetical protein